MIVQPFGTEQGPLADLREGMDVVDAAGARLGTVRQVYLGGEDLSEAAVAGDRAAVWAVALGQAQISP